MSENENLIDYYKELLIMQYAENPKAVATVDALVRSSMIFDIAAAVRDGYDIETAVGAQQDVLGKYVGASRVITGTTFTRNYFGFSQYGDTSPFTFYPMVKYGEAAPDAQFRNYNESKQSLYALNDEEYRIIQKLAIVRNNSNASVKDIDDILYQLFGAECYFIDRMNMTVVSYMVGVKWSRLFTIAKSSGLLPNPAGVGTGLIVVPDINHIFAFSLYGGAKPDFAVGFGKYPGWTLNGSELSVSDGNFFCMAKMTSSRITLAYRTFAGTNPKLSVYDYNGTNFMNVGNSLLLSDSLGWPSVTALSATRIAFIDTDKKILQAYDFYGTDFIAVGNPLSLSFWGSITALSSTRIAFVDNYDNKKLKAYDFDGTDWTITGNELTVGGIGPKFSIASLSTSRIALVSDANIYLRAYDFDGTDWTQKGNQLSIRGSAIAALSSSKISLCNSSNRNIKNYSFDETDWTYAGGETPISGMGNPAMVSFSETEIAFIDENNNMLGKYDFTHKTTGCMATYS